MKRDIASRSRASVPAACLLAGLVLAAGCGGGSASAPAPSPTPFKPILRSFGGMAALPEARTYLSAIEVGGSIYAVGGLPPLAPRPPYHNTTTTVFLARILAGGVIDRWQETASLNVSRSATALVAWNPPTGARWLYAVGGQSDDGGGETTVERALIQPDGTLSHWEMTDPLPASLSLGTMARIGNTVILVGVSVDSSARNLVLLATLGPDGFGPWRGGTSLPEPTLGGAAFSVRDRVHVVVGNTGSDWSSHTYSATLDAAGNLGAWTPGPPIGVDRYLAPLAPDGHGGAFLLGGIGRRDVVTTVEHSATDAAGNLLGWTTAGALPTPTAGMAAVTVGSSLYTIGGLTGSIPGADGTAAVWISPIE
jgi:hypothetical protein